MSHVIARSYTACEYFPLLSDIIECTIVGACAGSPPSEGSFACHATLLNHVLYGASYPRGGASEIAFHMIPVIERAGGRVLVRAPVSQILFDAGKVAGDAMCCVSVVLLEAYKKLCCI